MYARESVTRTPEFRQIGAFSPRRRLLPAIPLLGVALLVTGCPPDTRIDVAALHDKEYQLEDVEPVAVTEDSLQLTDFRPYEVSPGDVLKVNITGLSENYEETAIKARVHADGKVNLPMVGRIEVNGLELEEVERAIVAAYVPDFIKSISVYVDLDETEQTTVMVAGAAGVRGLVTLPRNERNVLYALKASTGLSATASSRVRVIPVRPDRDPSIYDLADINDLRRALIASPLQSGDLILVEPEDASAVFLTGLLNAPGPIDIPRGSTLSVMRAIAAAGGLVDFLAPTEATLWRRMPNGEQVRVKLDLGKIMNGEDADLALASGDIIDIPHTAKTRFLQWAVENVKIGPFGATAVYDPILEYRANRFRNTGSGGGFFTSIFDNVLSTATISQAVRTATP